MKRIFKYLIIAVGVIFGLYLMVVVAINIHGGRELQKALAQAEAQGVSLNWNDYVPKPIPEDENLYALPEWERFWNKQYDFSDSDKELGKRIGLMRPYDWRTGTPFPDAWLKEQNKHYNKETDTDLETEEIWQHISNDLSPYQAELASLTETAWSRPYFQVPFQDGMPFDYPILSFAQLRTFSRALLMDGMLAVQNNDDERAFNNLKALGKLGSIGDGSPLITSHMGGIFIQQNAFMPLFFTGLKQGIWSDPQLEWIQSYLSQRHSLNGTFWAIRSEMAAIYAAWNDWMDWNMKEMLISWGAKESNTVESAGMNIAPKGYVKDNMAKALEGYTILVSSYNPNTESYDPDIAAAYNRFLKDLDENSSIYYALATMAVGSFDSTIAYALNTDTYARMGAIACALERYKIANGSFPDSLATLTPEWMSEIPKDPAADGAPFHYEALEAVKSYWLWSVGGNRTDDGGLVVLENSGRNVSNEAGDWVFPYPQTPEQLKNES